MLNLTAKKFANLLGDTVLGTLNQRKISQDSASIVLRQKCKPNVMLFLADNLSYGDLGCYGQKFIKTPHLDQMAADGIRFTDFYSGSTVCAPSRCTLMTGNHTGHSWMRGNDIVPLRPEDITVAEPMKASGYTTGIFGKWGLDEPGTTGVPNKKGFDEWLSYLNIKEISQTLRFDSKEFPIHNQHKGMKIN